MDTHVSRGYLREDMSGTGTHLSGGEAYITSKQETLAQGWFNVGYSLRRWPNIESALGQGIVFAACPRSQQHATGHSAASFSEPH